jgi:hypothetical protein
LNASTLNHALTLNSLLTVTESPLWVRVGCSSYVATGLLLSIAAASCMGALMQLISQVFEGSSKSNALFTGLCHTVIAVSLVLFKSIYGPLWYPPLSST